MRSTAADIGMRAALVAFHRRAIDARQRGAGLALGRVLLRALSLPYGAAVLLRNLAFDAGLLRAHRAGVPVVSVGNLAAGGTGKTPMVALLARAAGAAGRRPAILTRGYRVGRAAGSDEAALLAHLLPDAPVVVDPDRVAGARRAVAAGADLLLLDDGFQHRRLARDADLVLLDARDPFGPGLLPRGLLREPRRALRRARLVVLTRCDRAGAEDLARARAAIAAAAPGLPVVEALHEPTALVAHGGGSPAIGEDPRRLAGVRVFAFSGIADPAALAETLVALGAEVAAARAFPDHHPFCADELAGLARQARSAGAALAVTTEKDLARIAAWPAPGHMPLAALRIQLRVRDETGRDRLAHAVGFAV